MRRGKQHLKNLKDRRVLSFSALLLVAEGGGAHALFTQITQESSARLTAARFYPGDKLGKQPQRTSFCFIHSRWTCKKKREMLRKRMIISLSIKSTFESSYAEFLNIQQTFNEIVNLFFFVSRGEMETVKQQPKESEYV